MATDDCTKCVCSQEWLSLDFSSDPAGAVPKQALTNRSPFSLLSLPLSLSAAFSSPGPKLQAIHDDPGLAPGHPELHEDTTVSFQPATGRPRPAVALATAGLAVGLLLAGRPELSKVGEDRCWKNTLE